MKNSKLLQILFVLIVLVVFVSVDAEAQCAMCKKNVESNLQTGGSVGKSLNTGILYLMAVPYLLLGSIVFVFFRKQIAGKLGFKKDESN